MSAKIEPKFFFYFRVTGSCFRMKKINAIEFYRQQMPSHQKNHPLYVIWKHFMSFYGQHW